MSINATVSFESEGKVLFAKCFPAPAVNVAKRQLKSAVFHEF